LKKVDAIRVSDADSQVGFRGGGADDVGVEKLIKLGEPKPKLRGRYIMIAPGIENSSGSIVFLDNFIGLLCNFLGESVAVVVRFQLFGVLV
jgi:hypothetical protein